jgi:CheY-like chemotaxis protein
MSTMSIPSLKDANTVVQKTILVVDDYPSVRFYHEYVIKKAGHRCETATNGREALAKIQQCPVDLVILDLIMPDMGGEAFIAEARKNPTLARIPVLVISTEPIGDQIRRACTSTTGAVGFAQKPLFADKLLAEVKQLLS